MRRTLGIRFGSLLLLALLLSQLPAAPCAWAEEPSAEYRVKAAFLQRFLMFITWPEQDRSAAGRTVTVGVVGNTDMAAVLQAQQAGTDKGPRFEVLTNLPPDEMAARCDVIFIPERIGHLKRTEHPQWKNLQWLEQRSVLTVGEDEDFLAAGGVIEFYVQDQRIRFGISSGAAKTAGLSIRADLMRLARVKD